MKNKSIIALVAIVVILAAIFAGIWWFNSNSRPDTNGSDYQATRTLAENQTTRKYGKSEMD